MNGINNAVMARLGLETTGANTAISAAQNASFGHEVHGAAIKPGCIVVDPNGHHVRIYIGDDARGNMMCVHFNAGGTVKIGNIPAGARFYQHNGHLDPKAQMLVEARHTVPLAPSDGTGAGQARVTLAAVGASPDPIGQRKDPPAALPGATKPETPILMT